MEPNTNQQNQKPPEEPVYKQNNTSKILQKTSEVASTIGIIAGIFGTIKSLFSKK